jgi:hypothetical protein
MTDQTTNDQPPPDWPPGNFAQSDPTDSTLSEPTTGRGVQQQQQPPPDLRTPPDRNQPPAQPAGAPPFPLSELARGFAQTVQFQGRPVPQWPPRWMPARRQRYIPMMPNRPWSEWGTARRWPSSPMGWEVPGIFMGLGAQLSRFGSGVMGPMAGNLGIFSGAWQKGYMQGQEQLARLRHQQMSDQAAQLDQQMQTEIDDYQRTFREYGDPDDPNGITPENKEKLEQALEAVARKYGDQHMLNALHSNGIQGAINQLRWLDAKHGDLKSSRSTLDKEQAQRDRLAPWQDTPQQGQPDRLGPWRSKSIEPEVEGTAPEEGKPPAPEDKPAEEERPAPKLDLGGEPAPQSQDGKPVQLAMGGDTMSDAPPPGAERLAEADQPSTAGQSVDKPVDYDPAPSQALAAAQGGRWHLSPTLVDSAAKRLVNGQAMEKGVPAEVQPYITARANEIRHEMDVIANSDLKGRDVLRALKKINPTFAGQLETYVDGSAPIPLTGAARNPMAGYILALGHKIDPTFTAATYQTRNAALKSFATGNDAKNMTSIATLDFHAARYEKNLQKLQQLQSTGVFGRLKDRVVQEYGRGMFGDYLADPATRQLFAELDIDEETASTEYEKAVSGGVPHAGARERSLERTTWRLSLTGGDLQGALANAREMQGLAHEREHVLMQKFEALVGRNRTELGKLYTSYAQRGENDATPEAVQVWGNVMRPQAPQPPQPPQPSRPATAPTAPLPGRSSLPQADEALRWLREHPNDPNAPAVRERLGL